MQGYGHNNLEFTYEMNGQWLKVYNDVKDFVILLNKARNIQSSIWFGSKE